MFPFNKFIKNLQKISLVQRDKLGKPDKSSVSQLQPQPQSKPAKQSRTDFFVQTICPILEMIGTVFVPFVIWYATDTASNLQKEKDLELKRQELLRNYLNQVTTIALGEVNIKKRPDIQRLVKATTLNVLQDANLDGNRKGQVISFLLDMNFVRSEVKSKCLPLAQWKTDVIGEQLVPEQMRALIDISSAEANEAKLEYKVFFGSNFRYSNFQKSKLFKAKVFCSDFGRTKFDHASAVTLTFWHSNLRFSSFKHAELENAGFYKSNLSNVSFYKADLQHVSFDGSNLDGAYFDDSNLRKADLSKANNLREEQLKEAMLCETRLSPEIKLDPNRDCEKLKGNPEKLRDMLSKIGLGELIPVYVDDLPPGQS
jgi:uncharacterized protein YjbI with pentapeptide repeats